MNVWIFNHYADTPDRQATRSYDLSKQLVERGHLVTIFAAGFSHYSFREERIRSGESWQEENCNGVRFIWVRTFPYKRTDWRRVLNMLSYAWRALWLGLKLDESPDVIIGVSVHPLAALSAWTLSVVKKSYFFFEVTDLWPQTLVEFGRLSPSNPLTWALRFLERFLYHRASKIIMLWRNTHNYLKCAGVSPAKIVWIPHGVVLKRYKPLKPYSGEFNGKFVVMYLGGLVGANALDVILMAARILQNRASKAHFVFV